MHTHTPVLLQEAVDSLANKQGSVIVDCTLGLGGHTRKILEKIGSKGKVIAFDQDERNMKLAKENLADLSSQIVFVHQNFQHLKDALLSLSSAKVDGFLFDLGLSSPHVDDPTRGFSFQKDGPLDMRFDPRNPTTAADVVNKYSEKNLARIFWEFGEDRQSRKLARLIVEERRKNPFETTTDLADFIKKHIKSPKGHPATKAFQALRIEVNHELDVLVDALNQAIDLLDSGGRIVVISYHSLEDRIVKNIFRDFSKDLYDPDDPRSIVIQEKQLQLITKKPIVPSDEEIKENPRARSAKMRVVEKL